MTVAYVLCAAALAALAVTTARLWSMLAEVAPARRMLNMLYPASQMLAVAFAVWLVGAYAFGRDAAVFVALLGMVCAVLDPVLFRSVLTAERADREAARARLLEEQVAAQKRHADLAQRGAAQADELRVKLLRELEGLEAALAAGDVARADGALAGAEYVVRPPEKRFCEHPAVDALLAAKAAQCAEAGVELGVAAAVPLDAGMQPVELCAVFANALDNALHACTAPGAAGVDGVRPRIELAARPAHGFFSLVVRNPCAPGAAAPARGVSGGFRSPLGEKRRGGGAAGGARADAAAALPEHGWGLSIIEAIVRRHDGDLSCTAERGVFTLSALWRL